MTDIAFRLASLRCTPVTPSGPDRNELDLAASRIGQRLVDVTGGWTLGYNSATEPDPSAVPVRSLSTVPLVAFGVCLGLCWTDRSQHPYPGEPVAYDQVIDALEAIGVNNSGAMHHFKGALNHELPAVGLLARRGDEVALGPRVATWGDAHIGLLHRAEHLLPTRTETA